MPITRLSLSETVGLWQPRWWARLWWSAGLAGGAALHGSGVTVDNGWVGVGCSPGQGRRARCQGTLGDQGHLTDRKEKEKKKGYKTNFRALKQCLVCNMYWIYIQITISSILFTLSILWWLKESLVLIISVVFVNPEYVFCQWISWPKGYLTVIAGNRDSFQMTRFNVFFLCHH